MSTKIKEKGKEKEPEGFIKFHYYAPEAREIYLSGDFNQWDPGLTPMKKGKNGVWKAKIKLPPGRYEYKFFRDGQWVQDDPEAERVPNPFGTENLVVRV